MFCVSAQLKNSDTRVFYKCPRCLKGGVYFTTVPVACNYCDYPLCNIESMEKSQSARYEYYRFAKY